MIRGRGFHGSYNGGFGGGAVHHNGVGNHGDANMMPGGNSSGPNGGPRSSSQALLTPGDDAEGRGAPGGWKGSNGDALTAMAHLADTGEGCEDMVVESLDCPHHLAGAVIGRHGSAIAQLRRETRCHIEIEASPGNGTSRAVTVCGPRAAVKDAVDRIRETLSQRVAACADQQNGQGHFGGSRTATDEDRQRTSRRLESLEARGVLRRAWLDERCMEVLMMLPFDVTGRVLHEAERVDLWKTRNVSAFLMMLVKTVQHYPDRRNGHGDQRQSLPPREAAYRQQLGPEMVPAHAMPVAGSEMAWSAPQAPGYAIYGPPPGYMAVPWVPGSYPQAFPGYGVPEYQVAYDPGYMAGYPPGAIAAPSVHNGAPSYGAPPGVVQMVAPGWDGSGAAPAGAVALPPGAPMPPAGYAYAPVAVLPASPTSSAHAHSPQQQQAEVFMESPPAALPYIGCDDGTQTPEDGSVIGDPTSPMHEHQVHLYVPEVLPA